MSEGVRNHHFSELCFPVTFSMGSGCAFHGTGEELGWRDGEESSASLGKLGVLEVRCGSMLLDKGCVTFLLWRSFPLVKLKLFNWREALLDEVPAVLVALGKAIPHVPKCTGPGGLCFTAWNIPRVGAILGAALGKFRRAAQRRGLGQCREPCCAAGLGPGGSGAERPQCCLFSVVLISRIQWEMHFMGTWGMQPLCTSSFNINEEIGLSVLSPHICSPARKTIPQALGSEHTNRFFKWNRYRGRNLILQLITSNIWKERSYCVSASGEQQE